MLKNIFRINILYCSIYLGISRSLRMFSECLNCMRSTRHFHLFRPPSLTISPVSWSYRALGVMFHARRGWFSFSGGVEIFFFRVFLRDNSRWLKQGESTGIKCICVLYTKYELVRWRAHAHVEHNLAGWGAVLKRIETNDHPLCRQKPEQVIWEQQRTLQIPMRTVPEHIPAVGLSIPIHIRAYTLR